MFVKFLASKNRLIVPKMGKMYLLFSSFSSQKPAPNQTSTPVRSSPPFSGRGSVVEMESMLPPETPGSPFEEIFMTEADGQRVSQLPSVMEASFESEDVPDEELEWSRKRKLDLSAMSG